MKYTPLLLAALFSCIGWSRSSASVTNVTAYGENSVYCYSYSLGTPGDVFTMNSIQSGPGGIQGWIYTDSAEDPTLTLQNTINNDTGFDWTGYHVDVFMNQSFTIASPSVLNSGWSGTITAQPTWNGSQYEGQIDFVGGTPVGANQILSFSYQISFSGSTSFTFSQTLSPVPEPGTPSLLLAGALLGGGLVFTRKLRVRTAIQAPSRIRAMV